ncbi:ParB N-terminal domain-containing protein [Streptomyces sp. NPDC046939]|uniref:ParB N-terminal domain-containing protein n=1 Tax=Streptomyces sp. NPDC046939 TaxID=3155376 RepID=UPI0033D9F686
MAVDRQHEAAPGGEPGANNDSRGVASMSATVRPAAGAYQVMPALTVEEYAALKADIAEHGIRVPVVLDQHGDIIDGHHRVAIAAELGIANYPRMTRAYATEKDRYRDAFALNMARRHLTRRQTRELIVQELARDPGRSNREIGRLLGADHKTVGAVRRDLAGEIPHPEQGGLSTAEAREITDAVRAHLNEVDELVSQAVRGGVAPIAIIGQLSVMLLDLEDKLGAERANAVRRSVVEPRIRDLIGVNSSDGGAS